MEKTSKNLRWYRGSARYWLRRYRGSHDISFPQLLLKAFPYTMVFLIAASPAFYLGVNFAGGFVSPDEVAGYMIANSFAEHGKLYIQDTITESNPDLSIGPRGFVEINGHGATIYSLGHPVLLGIAHKLFDGLAPALLAIIPGLVMLGLAVLVRLLNPAANPYLGLVVLGATPLWYWISRIYMNLAVTLLFMSWGLVCFVLAVRNRSFGWYFAAGAAFALAASMRNQEAPLLLILALAFTVIFLKHIGPFRWDTLFRAASIYCVTQLVFFILPMAILNWQTYGSPTTVGYQVQYEQIHPERVPINGNLALSAISFVKLAFFPTPTSFGVLWNGILHQLLLMIPVLVGLSIAALILARQHLTTTYRWGALILAIALAYVLISRSVPGIYQDIVTESSIPASLVRYWMPVYLAVTIGAAYALSHLNRIVSLSLTVQIVAISAYQVWANSPQAILDLQRNLEVQSSRYGELLQQNTEPEAVIVASIPNDKWVAQWRRTIAINLADPTEESGRRVVGYAKELIQHGLPVYFLSAPGDPHPETTFEIANKSLSQESLEIAMIADPPFGGRLWEVKSSSSLLKLEKVDGITYKAQAYAPGPDFSIYIEQDGSRHNLITNPSFETGLQGWSGPNVGGTNRSIDQALVGKSSMRMELTAQPGELPYIVIAQPGSKKEPLGERALRMAWKGERP